MKDRPRDRGKGQRVERVGKRGSHLHGPLELLTSDGPVEGLEEAHGGTGVPQEWGSNSIWQRGDRGLLQLPPLPPADLPLFHDQEATHTCNS